MGRQEQDTRMDDRIECCRSQGKAATNVSKDAPQCVDDERNVEEGGGDSARRISGRDDAAESMERRIDPEDSRKGNDEP